MTTAINSHRETALNSPYSRDRQEAITELYRAYQSTEKRDRDRILESLREVAHDSSTRDDRELAQKKLLECFHTDPSGSAPVVIETFRELAENSKFSGERIDAIDALRECYPDASEQYRDGIETTLADIAGNATYEDERDRARRRLSDITAEEGRKPDEDAPEAVGYLGRSLAEHLENAAREGPEACLRRAEELEEFLADYPVSNDNYDEVVDDIESLVRQLEVVPTGDELDEDRRTRVERVATRVGRLYARN